MRKLIASALLIASLTGCAASTLPAIPSPAPSVSDTVLGPDPTEAYAWEIFDHGGGAAKLIVNPSRPYKVEFMAATLEYPSWADAKDAIIPGKDGRWYWFHATYLD
jgi:hypothetical protein